MPALCAAAAVSVSAASDMTGCLKCAADQSLSNSAAYGCNSCFAAPSKYLQGCLSCIKQFTNGPDTLAARNCGGCAQDSIQSQAGLSQQCYSCVANSSANTGSYCSMLVGSLLPGAGCSVGWAVARSKIKKLLLNKPIVWVVCWQAGWGGFAAYGCAILSLLHRHLPMRSTL